MTIIIIYRYYYYYHRMFEKIFIQQDLWRPIRNSKWTNALKKKREREKNTKMVWSKYTAQLYTQMSNIGTKIFVIQVLK